MLKSAIRKVKQVPELKNVYDAEERKRLLKGAFEANAQAIKGQQISLIVLDLHTLSSTPIGYNEFGHAQFDTT